MAIIEIFNHSIPSIGYVSRTVTQGEEFEMVNSFINYFIKKKSDLTKKQIAIFVEPQIDTGYPDIVVVEYYSSKLFLWNDFRFKLTNNDLKILFEIQKRKKTSKKELEILLGFKESTLCDSLSRLNSCGMLLANKTFDSIYSKKLETFCQVKNIISIEAKMDKWNEAIQQATNNTWFASESYILMKKNKCNDEVINLCKERGVGIILQNDKIYAVLESKKSKFPVSYSSFLFNEWIFRRRFLKEEL